MKKYICKQTAEEKIYMIQSINHFDKKIMYGIINRINMYSFNSSNPVLHSPVTIEIVMRNTDEVNRLLSKGYDVNEISDYGTTPLITAIWCNNVEMVKLLLDRGANVNIKCNNDLSPLHYACDKKNVEIIKLLIERGANVNEVDELGYNALQHLIACGNVPNLSQKNGFFRELYSMTYHRTIINDEHSSYKSILKAISLLIENGIDIDYCNPQNGLNALSIALEVTGINYDKIVDCLIKLGSNREAIEINPHTLYEYQDHFDLINDIKDFDFSLWPFIPAEYIRYIEYGKRIKKNKIVVRAKNMDDGYKRPKLLVK